MGKGYTRGVNLTGAKWTKGGAKRRKNFIALDFSAFAEYAEKLDRLGADLQKIFTEVMEEAGQDVQEDVRSAISKPNLPAAGNYSDGDTAKTIVEPVVKWSGSVGELPLGFDKSKPGAGGFLITGTPKMAPDAALADIFTSRRYENNLKKQIEEALQQAIDEHMG